MLTNKRLQHAQSLHQQGQLDEALREYLALLEENPREAQAWHLTALLYLQRGEINKAKELLANAIKLLPNEASLHNSLGNVLNRNKESNAAIKAYQTALTLQPAYPGALCNLGNVYLQLKQWHDAKKCYLQALDTDEDYPDAHFNLARFYVEQNEGGLAEKHLHHALKIAPEHAAALGQLAELLLQKEAYDEALPLLKKRVTIQPQHPSAWQSLGLAFLKTKQYAFAYEALKTAQKLQPTLDEIDYQLATTCLNLQHRDQALSYYLRQLEHGEHSESLYNLGVLLADKQRDAEAKEYFERALTAQPDYLAAHLNLAALYLKANATAKAIQHYQAALAIDPQHQETQHILHALVQDETPSKAPVDYAEHLFDHYAAVYDQHLNEQLKYQVPHSLFDRVASALYPEKNSLTILDLGCGTGLAGELFAPYAKQLIGVDISSGMLALAKAKNIYHELILSSLETSLENCRNIDLIIAADVFPYLGDLQEVFNKAFQALNAGGILAFTTEKTTGEGYVLQKTVRYAHSQHYINSLAHKMGFTIYDSANVVLREQYHKPVEGYLYLLRKP